MTTEVTMEAPGDEAPARTATVMRDLAMGVFGSAVFGAAAAVGDGVHSIARGAWTAPALFVGGALLAMPPQYLFTALAGGRTTPGEVLTGTSRVLAGVATVLLGLAAPAAFFSATLHTNTGLGLLVAVVVSLGTLGVVALTGSRLANEESFGARCAAFAWCLFALALGGRLMSALAHFAGI